MPNYNKLQIIGHLTRDPQLKFLPSQTALAEGGIAVSRKFKTAGGEAKEEVCFIDWTCFGKSAEVLCQYVHKGSPIFLEGRLKQDNWEDKTTGAKRSKLTMVVENFQFLGGNGSGGQTETPGGKKSGIAAELRDRSASNAPQDSGIEEDAGLEIPF